MRSTMPAVRENASEVAATFSREILKPAAVENCGKKLPGYSFGRLARYLWPQKTPASIEFYTGISERTARHIAADKSDPGSIRLAELLDSDQGWRALCWIMRDMLIRLTHTPPSARTMGIPGQSRPAPVEG